MEDIRQIKLDHKLYDGLKLTKSSQGQTCIKCGAPNAYACHYNGPRQHSLGKGRGIKCHDLATAELCYKCDQEYLEGSTNPRWPDKWYRSEEFLFWVVKTNIRRYEQGRLRDG
jgi:hypothetical protein